MDQQEDLSLCGGSPPGTAGGGPGAGANVTDSRPLVRWELGCGSHCQGAKIPGWGFLLPMPGPWPAQSLTWRGSSVSVRLARTVTITCHHRLSGCTLWGISSSSDLRAEPARPPRVTPDLHMPWLLLPHPESCRGLISPSRGYTWSRWEILGFLPSVFPRGGHQAWLMTPVQEPCWREESEQMAQKCSPRWHFLCREQGWAGR